MLAEELLRCHGMFSLVAAEARRDEVCDLVCSSAHQWDSVVEASVPLGEFCPTVRAAEVEAHKESAPLLKANVAGFAGPLRPRNARLMASFLRIAPISRAIDGVKSLWVVDPFLFSRGVNLIAVPVMEAASPGEKSQMNFLVCLFPSPLPKFLSADLAAMDARPFLLVGTRLREILSAISTLVIALISPITSDPFWVTRAALLISAAPVAEILVRHDVLS